MNKKRKNNIVLIGFMGCGKTSIGKRIAANFGIRFIDTDIEIENTVGLTINDIFSKYGEEHFRRLERNFCKLTAFNSQNVIATGGGIIKNETNVENLKINGVVVYLKSAPEKVYRNIKTDTTRPLLNNATDKLQAITDMMEQRRPLYEKYADLTIDVTNMRLEESAWQVGRELRRLRLYI